MTPASGTIPLYIVVMRVEIGIPDGERGRVLLDIDFLVGHGEAKSVGIDSPGGDREAMSDNIDSPRRQRETIPPAIGTTGQPSS